MLAGLAHLSLRAARGGPRAAARRGRRHHRLRHGRAARGDAGVHPRGAGRRRSRRCRRTRARSGCRSCARRSPAGSRGASARTLRPRHRGDPDARLQGGDLRARERASTATSSPCPTPSYPVYERGALFAGKRVVELPLTEENGWLPGPRRRRLGPRRAAVAQLPEQPDGRDARRSSSTSTPPSWPASTASCSPPTRRTRSSTSASRPASALQVADRTNVLVFNTLSKRSSMPGYRSGFVAGDPEHRRRAEALPAERRRRAAGVRPARGGRRLERRGARRRGARALPGQARRAAARAGGARRCATRAATRRSSSGSRAATTLAARWLEAGVVVAPGSFFGAPGYFRLALVPPLETCVRGARQSFACSAALRPAQLPERGSASTVPVRELRRNSRPFAPLSSRP